MPQIAPVVVVERPVIMSPPVFVQQPAIQMQMTGPVMLGNLKLHLKEAHLTHVDQIFERMSPFVIIKINGREWRSAVCEFGGRKPHWTLQFMDIEVMNMEHEILIEVRDRDPMMTEPIGHVTTRVNFFAVPGGRAEWLELFYRGMPAGRIHFKSEFYPQMAPVAIVERPVLMAP